jgi:Rrf2 family cysteine metabolism transcriptional repressor
MKLSTKGRYATRAMLHLAMHNNKRSMLLKDIAKEQEISERYLENIMRTLVSNGLVNSIKGRNGGFSLAKKPEDINLSHIIEAVEGPTSPVFCVDSPQLCNKSEICFSREVWGRMKNAVFELLDSITLKEMAERQKEKLEKAKTQMYYI